MALGRRILAERPSENTFKSRNLLFRRPPSVSGRLKTAAASAIIRPSLSLNCRRHERRRIPNRSRRCRSRTAQPPLPCRRRGVRPVFTPTFHRAGRRPQLYPADRRRSRDTGAGRAADRFERPCPAGFARAAAVPRPLLPARTRFGRRNPPPGRPAGRNPRNRPHRRVAGRMVCPSRQRRPAGRRRAGPAAKLHLNFRRPRHGQNHHRRQTARSALPRPRTPAAHRAGRADGQSGGTHGARPAQSPGRLFPFRRPQTAPLGTRRPNRPPPVETAPAANAAAV